MVYIIHIPVLTTINHYNQPGYYRDEGIPRTVLRMVHRCYWLLASVAFCVMEVDRINWISTVSEAEELRQGYLDISGYTLW